MLRTLGVLIFLSTLYVEELAQQHMREHQLRARQLALERANRRVIDRAFEAGDWVTVKSNPRHRPIGEVGTRRDGPYQIVARHGAVYTLVDEEGKPLPNIVHGELLMPFRRDPLEEQGDGKQRSATSSGVLGSTVGADDASTASRVANAVEPGDETKKNSDEDDVPTEQSEHAGTTEALPVGTPRTASPVTPSASDIISNDGDSTDSYDQPLLHQLFRNDPQKGAAVDEDDDNTSSGDQPLVQQLALLESQRNRQDGGPGDQTTMPQQGTRQQEPAPRSPDLSRLITLAGQKRRPRVSGDDPASPDTPTLTYDASPPKTVTQRPRIATDLHLERGGAYVEGGSPQQLLCCSSSSPPNCTNTTDG